jgi:inhibitor of KinA sporulation pathway (predicted exonuclease)
MNVMTLDCEFNQPSQKLIEIGAAVYQVNTRKQIAKIEIFVNPFELLNPEIIELTGITDADLENAVDAKTAYFMLKEFHKEHHCFMNPIVWGSGVRNDSLLIWQQAEVEELNFMGYRVIDAKTIYQSLRMQDNRKIKSGVKGSMEELGLTFVGREHRALPDAVNTFTIWSYLTKTMSFGFDTAKRAETINYFME